MTWTVYINVCSLFPRRLNIKFGFDRQAVSEERMFEIVDDNDDNNDDDDNGRRSMDIL